MLSVGMKLTGDFRPTIHCQRHRYHDVMVSVISKLPSWRTTDSRDTYSRVKLPVVVLVPLENASSHGITSENYNFFETVYPVHTHTLAHAHTHAVLDLLIVKVDLPRSLSYDCVFSRSLEHVCLQSVWPVEDLRLKNNT